MREIKFRGWDGERVYEPEDLTTAPASRVWLGREDMTLMQFTGLRDKNGVEIYEGDILEDDMEWWQVQYTDRAMYEAIAIPRGVDFALEEIVGSATVQGNIFENPELLNV